MTFEEFKKCHKLLKQFKYTWAPINKGYNNRTIYVNVGDLTIKEKPVSAEMKDALMTPFMDTETLGQGVGLPLCRMILERHGSSFAIEDRPGGGTRYCIILNQKKEALG